MKNRECRIWMFVGLLLCGLVGCSAKSAVEESPFRGTGAVETGGIIGVMYLGADAVRSLASGLEFVDATSDFDLVVTTLDREEYGAEAAIDFGGAGATDALADLVDTGFLQPIDGRGEAYRIQSPFSLLGMGGGLPPGFGPMSRQLGMGGELRRYDVGGRVLLLPTVDLRDLLAEMGSTIRREHGPASFAVALDGEETARFVERSILPMFEGASTLLEAFAGAERDESVQRAAFGGRVAIEALTQLDGLVFSGALHGERFSAADLRLTARAGSTLERLFASATPIEGEWPLRSPGLDSLRVSFDARSLADAIDALIEPALDDRLLTFVEEVEQAVDAVRRLGLDGFAADGLGRGASRVAARVPGAVDVMQLRRVEEFLEVSLDAEDGWLTSAPLRLTNAESPEATWLDAAVTVGDEPLRIQSIRVGAALHAAFFAETK